MHAFLKYSAVALALFLPILFSGVSQGEQLGPVIVVTGGYDSCTYNDGSVSAFGGNFNAEGVRFVNDIYSAFSATNRNATEKSVRWVFSCFNKNSELFVQDNSDDGIVDAWDMNGVIDRIERQSEDYARPVYIIGHSHGGWLALRLAESLRRPLVGGFLATIDPISFVECNAATYADALIWSALSPAGSWASLAPCRQAPGDITGMTVRQIKKIVPTGNWKHYYQRNFLPLHSGPMAGPDSELDMSAFLSLNGGVARSINAHVRIANLSSIWYGLGVSIRRDYGLNE